MTLAKEGFCMEAFYKKVSAIQGRLKVPKSQWNDYGEFHYRKMEDILDALKPELLKEGLFLYISDEILGAPDYPYIEATVTLCDGDEELKISVKAQAGISPKKGMDLSQCFGCSSTYARKYALSAMFLLDDGDLDSSKNDGVVDVTKKSQPNRKNSEVPADKKEWLEIEDPNFEEVRLWLKKEGNNMYRLRKKYKVSRKVQTILEGKPADESDYQSPVYRAEDIAR